MIWFLKGSYEKILVALAAGVLALSLGWTWHLRRQLRVWEDAIRSGTPSTGRLHTPASWRPLALEHATWAKAPEQSAGTGWLYELFTPPVIFYNAETHAFAVAVPRRATSRGAVGADRSAPVAETGRFRLQLTGYFGTPNDYLVAMVSPESGETRLARVGQRFPDLGLALTGFEVKKVPVEHAEPWPVYDVVGFATLRDERTGKETVLDTRPRKRTDNPGATLSPTAPAVESLPVTVAGRSDPISVFPASSEPERSQ